MNVSDVEMTVQAELAEPVSIPASSLLTDPALTDPNQTDQNLQITKPTLTPTTVTNTRLYTRSILDYTRLRMSNKNWIDW